MPTWLAWWAVAIAAGRDQPSPDLMWVALGRRAWDKSAAPPTPGPEEGSRCSRPSGRGPTSARRRVAVGRRRPSSHTPRGGRAPAPPGRRRTWARRSVGASARRPHPRWRRAAQIRRESLGYATIGSAQPLKLASARHAPAPSVYSLVRGGPASPPRHQGLQNTRPRVCTVLSKNRHDAIERALKQDLDPRV